MQCKHRTTKGVQKSHVGSNLDSAESFELGLALLAGREDVAQVRGVAQSVRPEGRADRLRPALPCVQELLSSALREVSNGSLGDAILEVSVDSAKGELLSLRFACLTKEAVREAPIVAVVVGDADPVLGGKAFEGVLRVDGFLASQIARHQINKLEARIMVDENSGILVSRLGEYPLCLCEKSWLGGLHLINRDTLPRLGRSENRVSCVALSFAAPRNFSHGSVEAAGAARGANASKALGDLAIFGKSLEASEGLVAEAVVPSHQLSLIVGRGNAILVLLGERRRRVVAKGISNDGRRGGDFLNGRQR